MDQKIWDYIIVGTGLGGGPVGLKLAQASHSVLFIEKGVRPTLKGRFAEEFLGDSKTGLKNAGRMSDPVQDCTRSHKKTVWPFMGSGVGGSSALYGMVLERFSERDLQTWPIPYQQMEKYYAAAELLFQVKTATRLTHPGVKELQRHFAKSGSRIYQLPMAHQENPNCSFCQSLQCAQGCKNHSGNICIDVAVNNYSASLLTDCEARKVLVSPTGRAQGVTAWYKDREITFQAQNVILAAGALNTPVLLMDSEIGNQSGLVGRNLMRHYVDLFALKMKEPADTANSKEIGINFGQDFALQSFGRLPPLDVIVRQIVRDNPILRMIQPLFKWILGRMLDGRLVLATILQDEPKFENRVWKENGELCISYQIDSKGKAAIKSSRRKILEAVRGFKPMIIKTSEKNEMLAHVCGTTKMGTDPQTSVVDTNNKVHGVQNLYVVDASFFPSSGSTNPGLTIAANSLRVADHLLNQEASL